MVIFVNGVFARVWAPNQFIARTEAWPPNQLQLPCKNLEKHFYRRSNRLTWYLHLQPWDEVVFELSARPKISTLLTQISIFNPEFAKAPSWGSNVLASYTRVTTLHSIFLTWLEVLKKDHSHLRWKQISWMEHPGTPGIEFAPLFLFVSLACASSPRKTLEGRAPTSSVSSR